MCFSQKLRLPALLRLLVIYDLLFCYSEDHGRLRFYLQGGVRRSLTVIRELDTVVLTRDFPEYGLNRGDIGAVVHSYKDGAAFEVEFVTGKGETVAVMTLESKDVRPMQPNEILHAREILAA